MMRYLNRRGDLEETASVESVCVFRNWQNAAPKFGFIVPTYKRADLLQYALNSILLQTTDVDFDILVVDDNPERDDETESLMTSKFNLSRVAYYKNNKNLRQGGNWNKLFEFSRSEWLIMLHDDDMLYPDYMRALLRCMSLYPESIRGYFPCFIPHEFNDDSLPDRIQCKIRGRIIKKIDFLQGCILGAPLGMCVKRELVVQLGGVNTHSGVAVDYDFFNRLVKATDVVKMYDYPLGVWRIMDNVSQKVETPLSCIQWGDILKMDTLEDCGLNWLKPLYIHYIKGFDHQHICNWYLEMEKGDPDLDKLPKASKLDKILYKIFRCLFSFNRHLFRNQQHFSF